MDKIERIKQLTAQLLVYCEAYYKYDNPLVSDAVYDRLYDELEALEKETGFMLNNSPTQKVQGELLESLTKVKHTTPMLSAQKSKDIKDIENFVGGKDAIASFKVDGLTIVCKYDNGEFIQAITRGSGIEGEDITHNMLFCTNLPKKIPYDDYLEVRGEGVISFENFNKINAELEKKYSHPRNLAAGSVRQLNAADRKIEFLAFNIVNSEDLNLNFKSAELNWLKKQGFTTVEWETVTTIKETIANLDRATYPYPTDGWIIEYNDLYYGKSLGATEHHTNNMIALKPENESVETKFLGIDYKTSRNGIVSLTAIFEPCEIDGTTVSRASVHNVDIFNSYELGEGDAITVYKANMIIPQIEDNLTRSGTYKLTNICPTCGGKLEKKKVDKSTVLYCPNTTSCFAQKLGKFTQLVSKDGFNIVGLSEATLDAIIDTIKLTSFRDLFHLEDHKEEILKLQGMGPKSYEKLITAIEKSRDIKMENFLTALGIPNIGKKASKTISEYFEGNYYRFIDSLENNFDFTKLSDFGEIMQESLYTWFNDKNRLDLYLDREVNFIKPIKKAISDSIFSGKTIVISGSFDCGSRDEIQAQVEALGGKFTSSVSKKTDILLAGKKCGSKLTKAQELGTQIIEEEELLKWLKQ